MTNFIKLSLGCGSDLQKGYLNIDIREPKRSKSGESAAEYEFRKSKIENLFWLENNSVSEIRAKDIIDHIYWKDLEKVFPEWNRVLKLGGRLLLMKIPDFEKSFQKYFQSGRTKQDWEKIQEWVEMLAYPNENFRSKKPARSFLFENAFSCLRI